MPTTDEIRAKIDCIRWGSDWSDASAIFDYCRLLCDEVDAVHELHSLRLEGANLDKFAPAYVAMDDARRAREEAP